MINLKIFFYHKIDTVRYLIKDKKKIFRIDDLEVRWAYQMNDFDISYESLDFRFWERNL